MSSADAKTEQILDGYCRRLPEELGVVTNLIEAAIQGERDCVIALDKLKGELHRMGGSALCMGYPFLGQSMMELESEVSAHTSFRQSFDAQSYRRVVQRMESIAKLVAYVRPENSHMLRKPERHKQAVEAHSERSAKGRRPDLSGKRVLFADDDLAIRMLMREILNSLGLKRFKILADGTTLLSEAKFFEPDLIITDWAMYPISGLDILRAVRSGRAGIPEETRVIFLTSENTSDKVQFALKQGLDYLLLKPFSIDGVSRAIHKVSAGGEGGRLRST